MFSATLAENRKLSSPTNAISERSEPSSTVRTSAPSTRNRDGFAIALFLPIHHAADIHSDARARVTATYASRRSSAWNWSASPSA